MLKKVTFLLASLGLIFSVTVAPAFAHDDEASVPEQINSFELFWPIVPGKTKGDSTYFLKKLKENVRGILIFGVPQKADYLAFLSTKRIVEAEKLINEDKKDLAQATLGETVANLKQVKEKVDQALSKGEPFPEQAGNISRQTQNIETFAKWLKSQKADYASSLEEIASISHSIKDALK